MSSVWPHIVQIFTLFTGPSVNRKPDDGRTISRVDHCLRAWKCTTMPGGAGSSPCESSRYNRNSGWRNNQSLGHNTLWENELIWFHHLRMCALRSKDNCKSMSLPSKSRLMILRAMMTISNDDNREWCQSAVMTIGSDENQQIDDPAGIDDNQHAWLETIAQETAALGSKWTLVIRYIGGIKIHLKHQWSPHGETPMIGLVTKIHLQLLHIDIDDNQTRLKWRRYCDWIGDIDPNSQAPLWWQPTASKCWSSTPQWKHSRRKHLRWYALPQLFSVLQYLNVSFWTTSTFGYGNKY